MTRENGLPWKWIVWDFAAWSFSDRSPGLEQREMIEAALFVCTVPTHTALLHKPQRDPTMRNLSLSWVIGSFMTQAFFESLQKNNFRLSSVYFMVGDGWEGEIVEAGKLSAFLLDLLILLLYMRQYSSSTAPFLFKTFNSAAAFSPILHFLSLFQK